MNDPVIYEDAFNLFCGAKIGEGISRTVFACRIDPTIVIKVEDSVSYRQNVIEWEIWQRAIGTPASRWLAQCKWISPNGKVLIMERTRPPLEAELPKRVPVYLTDLKRTNYGMAKTNKAKEYLVCHDYGTSLIFEKGLETKAFKKADWWSVERS
jgi:hypothetical protein